MSNNVNIDYKFHDVRFCKDVVVGNVYKAHGSYFEVLAVVPLDEARNILVISDLEPVDGLSQTQRVVYRENYLFSIYVKYDDHA